MGTNLPSLESPPAEEKAGPSPSFDGDEPVKTVTRTISLGSTDYERNLRRFVVEKARLGREVSIGAIMVDPRHPRASFVVSLAPRRSDPGVVRGVALRAATRVAAAAMAGDAVLNTITVNVRLKSGTDRFLPVFAGDADRNASQSLGENPSLEQMLTAYSSYWWAPNFAPPGVSQNQPDSGPPAP
jgi:hypothetical protein